MSAAINRVNPLFKHNKQLYDTFAIYSLHILPIIIATSLLFIGINQHSNFVKIITTQMINPMILTLFYFIMLSALGITLLIVNEFNNYFSDTTFSHIMYTILTIEINILLFGIILQSIIPNHLDQNTIYNIVISSDLSIYQMLFFSIFIIVFDLFITMIIFIIVTLTTSFIKNIYKYIICVIAFIEILSICLIFWYSKSKYTNFHNVVIIVLIIIAYLIIAIFITMHFIKSFDESLIVALNDEFIHYDSIPITSHILEIYSCIGQIMKYTVCMCCCCSIIHSRKASYTHPLEV